MKKKWLGIVALLFVVKYNRVVGTEQMIFPGAYWEDAAPGTPNKDRALLVKKSEK